MAERAFARNIGTGIEIRKVFKGYVVGGMNFGRDEFAMATRATEPDGNAQGRPFILRLFDIDDNGRDQTICYWVMSPEGVRTGEEADLFAAERRVKRAFMMARKLTTEQVARRQQDWRERVKRSVAFERQIEQSQKAREVEIRRKEEKIGFGEW